jgi:hypothetical protein
MEPTPDREEDMPAEVLDELEARAAYRVESTDDEIVVRIPRGVASEEQVKRYLALMVLDAVRQGSELTEADALALGDEVNRAVSDRMRRRLGLSE